MLAEPRIGWVTNRLRVMEPGEILSRLADVARHVALRASLETIRPGAQDKHGNSDFAVEHLRSNGHQASIPAQLGECIIAHADRWLDHRASFFALKDTPLGDEINWHRDSSSGIVAPLKYSASINHRDPTLIGDVKYVWELNRLQQLVLLALASVWTGAERYTAEIQDQTASWIKQNPFMIGVNWKSPLEAAIRLISWALSCFLAGQLRKEQTFRNELYLVVYQHQYFIKKFYSKHSSANNHLIGEMAGLYIASIFWPGYKESARWRSFARRKLIEEMARQVELDGVGSERATEYQLFILEFFLLAGTLGQGMGDPFPEAYWDGVHRMAAFLSAISDRSGHLPTFGDGDSGQIVWLPQTTEERAGSILRLFQPNRTEALEDLRSWLLSWGQVPMTLPPLTVPTSTDSLQVFPDGGYYVLACDRGGEKEFVVVFDVGPIGQPPMYAHGHADALSFWLSYAGHEFLIDPGTYCYYNSPAWRAYFRGTAAHNTIRIDQQDQSVPAGPFLWRQTANCRTEYVSDRDDCVEVAGFHDGYLRLQDPVKHTRSLRLFQKSHSLQVTDRLDCAGSHEVEMFFHFGEKCGLRQVGPNIFEAVNSNTRLLVRLDAQVSPALYRASENPMAGWVSRTFGVKEPAYTLIARATVPHSTEFTTEISAT